MLMPKGFNRLPLELLSVYSLFVIFLHLCTCDWWYSHDSRHFGAAEVGVSPRAVESKTKNSSENCDCV